MTVLSHSRTEITHKLRSEEREMVGRKQIIKREGEARKPLASLLSLHPRILVLLAGGAAAVTRCSGESKQEESKMKQPNVLAMAANEVPSLSAVSLFYSRCRRPLAVTDLL